MDAEAVAAFKKTSVADWGYDAGDLVRNGYDIVKVCLILLYVLSRH